MRNVAGKVGRKKLKFTAVQAEQCASAPYSAGKDYNFKPIFSQNDISHVYAGAARDLDKSVNFFFLSSRNLVKRGALF